MIFQNHEYIFEIKKLTLLLRHLIFFELFSVLRRRFTCLCPAFSLFLQSRRLYIISSIFLQQRRNLNRNTVIAGVRRTCGVFLKKTEKTDNSTDPSYTFIAITRLNDNDDLLEEWCFLKALIRVVFTNFML